MNLVTMIQAHKLCQGSSPQKTIQPTSAAAGLHTVVHACARCACANCSRLPPDNIVLLGDDGEKYHIHREKLQEAALPEYRKYKNKCFINSSSWTRCGTADNRQFKLNLTPLCKQPPAQLKYLWLRAYEV